MKLLLLVIVFLALFAGVLFGSAGRIDLPFFWAVLGISAVYMPINVLAIDPELRHERASPGAGGVSRRFRLVMIPLIIGSWAISGLDVGRFHWTDSVPRGVQIAALAGLVVAWALAVWAMRANRFFSPVVRVQRERGHHVVDTGPYAFVRHPGYVASVLVFFFAALALGSWLATALTPFYAAAFAYRTVLEERYLRENLPGYARYTTAVRARWVPGAW